MPLAFQGDPIPLTLQTSSLADSAQLLIRDANGTLVQRLDVPPGGGTFTWTGRDAGNTPLHQGQYTATVASYSQGEVIASHPAQVQATVIEARQSNGQTQLVMSGGQSVTADEIIALRDPSG
jgi:flagellar basal-body rod modification protein FlgD